MTIFNPLGFSPLQSLYPIGQSLENVTKLQSVKNYADDLDLLHPEGAAKAIARLGIDHPIVVNAMAKATETEPQFVRKLLMVAERLDTSAMHLLVVMKFETAGLFKTGLYESSGATGLIQFTSAGVGEQEPVRTSKLTDREYLKDIARMSRVRQLDEVEEYLGDRKELAGGDYHELLKVYLSVFAPDTLRRIDTEGLHTVAYSREGYREAYESNSGLDANRDKRITVGEIFSRILKTRTALLSDIGYELVFGSKGGS